MASYSEKIRQLSDEARQAFEDGHFIFTPRLKVAFFQHTSTGSIAGWSSAIEAIENEGWLLCHWSVINMDHKAEAYPLFRRT